MDTSISSPVASLKWYEVWRDVWLRPTGETFQRLLADPTAREQRAFLWVAVAAAIEVIISGIVDQSSPGVTIIAVIISPVVAVISLVLSAILAHWGAGWSGGSGTRRDLIYVFGAIIAPTSLISSLEQVINSASLASVLGLFLLSLIFVAPIYTIFLYVRAVHFIEKIGYLNSLLALIVPGLLIGIMFFFGYGVLVGLLIH